MKKLAGFLGVLSLVALAPLARANYVISYNANGTATNCANSSNDDSATCAPTVNMPTGLTISQLSGSSNSPGGTPLPVAQQFGTLTSITNTSGSAQTVTIWFAAQNFSFPTAPPSPAIDWVSNLQVTQTLGQSKTTLEGCIDTSNGTAPPTGTFCSSGPTLANDTLSQTGASTPPTDTVMTSITSLASPYSLSQVLTIVLQNNTSLNVATSQVLTPVPEPASIMLMGSLLAGIATLIRKKAARRA